MQSRVLGPAIWLSNFSQCDFIKTIHEIFVPWIYSVPTDNFMVVAKVVPLSDDKSCQKSHCEPEQIFFIFLI